MEIAAACEVIRQCNVGFVYGRPLPEARNKGVVEALGLLKKFLETARADGESIHELEIADNLLCTASGMKWVMPFVQSAEAIEASMRRAQLREANHPTWNRK